MNHFCIFENDLSFVSPPLDLNLIKIVLTFVYLLKRNINFILKMHFFNFRIKLKLILLEIATFTFKFNSKTISFLSQKLYLQIQLRLPSN